MKATNDRNFVKFRDIVADEARFGAREVLQIAYVIAGDVFRQIVFEEAETVVAGEYIAVVFVCGLAVCNSADVEVVLEVQPIGEFPAMPYGMYYSAKLVAHMLHILNFYEVAAQFAYVRVYKAHALYVQI